MASNFYDKNLPDYTDLHNDSGKCLGFRFGVRENDGGIGLDMGPATDNVDGEGFYRGFLNVVEAEELVFAIQQAIARARLKGHRGLPHPSRVTDP